jgi:hypothetical protein
METSRRKKKVGKAGDSKHIPQVISISTYGSKKAVVLSGRFDLQGEAQIVSRFFFI